MGLFDNLTGALGGVLGGGEGEGGGLGALSGLLQGGAGANSSNIVGALLGGGQQGGDGAAGGGMGEMLETLAANGLGDHVNSWLSGSGLPISPEQIKDALGSDQVQQMASASGLPVGDFLKHLADHLPAAAAQSAGVGSDQG
jgi:uncharacterized protein YidB (DUF937 family)